MKPRIRLIFDGDQSPEEVRVILGAPTKNTQTYNEFKDLLLVEADEKKGEISSIRLNCKALGGKVYEDALLALLADYKRLLKWRGVTMPAMLKKHMTKCEELITAQRIDARLDKIAKEREKIWGPLHNLIEDAAVHHYGVADARDKLLNHIKAQPDWKSVIREAVVTIYEEFGSTGSGRVTQLIRGVLGCLTHEQFIEFLTISKGSKSYERTYWTMFQRALTERSHMPVDDYINCHALMYDALLEAPIADGGHPNEVDYRTRQSVLENLEMFIGQAVRTQEQLNAVKTFVEKIHTTDPSAHLRQYAQEYLQIPAADEVPMPPGGMPGMYNDDMEAIAPAVPVMNIEGHVPVPEIPEFHFGQQVGRAVPRYYEPPDLWDDFEP
jgi:hypothetical protein